MSSYFSLIKMGSSRLLLTLLPLMQATLAQLEALVSPAALEALASQEPQVSQQFYVLPVSNMFLNLP